MDTKPILSWINIIATMGVILTAGAGAWSLFQAQFSSMEKQFSLGQHNQGLSIDDLNKRIERNSVTAVPRLEHEEFVKRLDREIGTINDRLRIIETTRPTTGELSAIGQNNREQVQEVKDRIRSLEDNLRRPNPLSPVTPPAPYYPPPVPAPPAPAR